MRYWKAQDIYLRIKYIFQYLYLSLPILDCFGEVRDFDIFAVREVRDGAGDFYYSVKSPGAKMERVDGLAEKCHFFLTERAEFFDMQVLHFRIGNDSINILKSFALFFAGRCHPFANGSALFAYFRLGQFFKSHPRDLGVDIN